MPNLLSSVNLLSQALASQQQAINVIEQNVANANTPGYHRQTAVLKAGPASAVSAMGYSSGSSMVGSGVMVEQINRFSTGFYDTRYRQSAADAGQWDQQGSVLSEVESLLNETDSSGVPSQLNQFWSSWQSLSGDPANLSLRSNLLDSARSLAQSLNSRMLQMDTIKSDQGQAISQRLDEINSAAQQIATLNAEISRILSTGNQPNDLLDQRDQLLDRLSQVAGVQASVQTNGEVNVSISGHSLVVGHDVTLLQTNLVTVNLADDKTIQQYQWQDGQVFSPQTGEIKGLIDAQTVINEQMNGLNGFAAGLIDAVNGVHQTGYDLNGHTGNDFFGGTDAWTIKVDPAVDSADKIAIASSADKLPGDGALAQTIANLKSTAVDVTTQTAAGAQVTHTTLANFYNQQVTTLGLTISRANSNAKSQGLTRDALDAQRQSVSGVSLDEEAANLVTAQRSYQAAARVMTALDQLMDTVINGMGLVGR